ncbi:GH16713 [Drosophila grimshawi]|uniref:GH16713 n=1 Tax=Drosophila grimshawi TaxID=7222 RepID=B4J3A7_DROGR|nr:GH16713 [Drosophila grimshawi]
MTSGEWDLRALKALEEEEQKEFLALSQRNLFEAPLPTGGPENGSITNSLDNAKPALSYAQLHPHLLKLPTIDECHLIAAQRQSAGSVASSARLKFTRALSLSAHSLSPRPGGRGGGGVGFGKKLKARLVGAKSSGSLSPSRHSHSYSVSPVYTPPPMRRCATLHHTQPVRKTFKTLQQLERQKQKQSNAAQAQATQSASTTPQLQRIVGTNKTYWKYGANSTAASIIGQRARLQQQLELDSNNSDEPPNGEALEADAIDSATETGSCSVPLPPADSNELLRLSLMLTAASTAMTATATATATAAATGGPVRRYHTHSDVEDETVAYEAFHRPKSFERSLLRGASLTLTAQESPSPNRNRSRAMQSTNGKRILKSTSLETGAACESAPTDIYQKQQQQQQLQQQQQQQKQQQQQQQQQIIGQPLGMMGLSTATNQLAEQQERESDWEFGLGLGLGREQFKYHQDLAVACYGHSAALDDELEHHIKHCSCSCNHMGYGNSMDYQQLRSCAVGELASWGVGALQKRIPS